MWKPPQSRRIEYQCFRSRRVVRGGVSKSLEESGRRPGNMSTSRANSVVDRAGGLGDRPRNTLQRKMLWWMLVMAVVPAVICLLLFNIIIWGYLTEDYRKNGDMLAQVVATSLHDRLDPTLPDYGWTRRQGELLDSLGQDPRVGFVCITDHKGKPLHMGIFDDNVWDAFVSEQKDDFNQGVLDINSALVNSMIGDNLVHTVPIINNVDAYTNDREVDDIEKVGYVIIALRNTEAHRALYSFQLVQILTILGVCVICPPFVAAILRRWTKPLRELLEATRRLASGQSPRPVAVSTRDELGYLSAAFNDMAGNLLASQSKLREANESLEHKVRLRTAELQDANLKLEEMATTDALTKLANRRAFNESIEPLFKQAMIYDADLAIVMIDLDGFKDINDTFGHEKGDELLVLTAKAMKAHCREHDIPSRQGGDEFIVVMPSTDMGTAKEIADKIRNQFELESRQMFEGVTPPPKVTMSMGLACLSQTKPESHARLIIQADKALYRAKDAGKSCLIIFEPSMEYSEDQNNKGKDRKDNQAAA